MARKRRRAKISKTLGDQIVKTVKELPTQEEKRRFVMALLGYRVD